MAVFMIETEEATSSAANINNLANDVSNLSSSVSGYDTSCEDGFDFATAKNVIANNLDACSTKIKNTSSLIDTVVSSHTELQNSLEFTDPTKKATDDLATNETNNAYYNDGGYYGGGGYYDGGGGYSGGGGGVNLSSSPQNIPGLVNSTVPLSSDSEEETDDDITQDPSGLKNGNDEEDSVIEATLEKVGYAYADESKLSDESKELLEDEEFTYDENGLARVGDMYVIACDASVGDVGDVIRFTQKDGSVVECVVGMNTVSDEYKNTINFIVDQEATSIQPVEVAETLLTNNDIVENVGTLEEVREAKKLAEEESIVLVESTQNVSDETVSVPTSTNSDNELVQV